MKKIITFLLLMVSITTNAQNAHVGETEGTQISPLGETEGALIRISEIEVYPEYLTEYLEFAHNVGATSVKEEPGVICIYPMQQLRLAKLLYLREQSHRNKHLTSISQIDSHHTTLLIEVELLDA